MPPRSLARAAVLGCAALMLALAGCGGGGGEGGDGNPPPMQTVDRGVTGRAVVKLRVAGGTLATLEERLLPIGTTGPERHLGIVQADGRTVRSYAAPEGWSLVDFAVHPSGDVSVVLSTAKTLRIVRLDGDAAVRSDQPFVDAAVADDPFHDLGGPRDDHSLQPLLMRDAARLAAIGEELAVVIRSGRHAVIAYRLARDGTGYVRRWRTLVEPGGTLMGRFLTSGSFDTFGQLENHARVHIDADAAGTLWVGVASMPSNVVFEAHAEHFGEPIAATYGAIVTRIAGDGRRVGSSIVDTRQLAELHALRATGSGVALVGRVRSEVRPDGSGWNAFVSLVGATGEVREPRVVDVDRGDVLFDIAPLPSGRLLALGATGYIQNPAGASISEDAQPLLALLNADGSFSQRLESAAGARHNQLRAVASFDGRWLVAGMRNGPGTHSGDAQPALITADGFTREVAGLGSR